MLRATQDRFQHAAEYKYATTPPTPFDTFLDPFWRYVQTLLPVWLHPNTISLIAWISSALCFTAVLWNTPTLEMGIGRWSSVFCAICIFIYQTFDAVDGKHARATGMASPLGTIFDHGLDITVTTMLALTAFAFLQQPLTFVNFFSVMVSSQVVQFIYLIHEHYFNVFRSNPGFPAGVTEVQLAIIAVALANAVFGPAALAIVIPGLGLPLWKLCVYILITGNGSVALYYTADLVRRVDPTQAVEAFCKAHRIVFFVIAEWFFIRNYASTGAPPFFCFVTCVAAYGILGVRLLLCNVTKQPFNLVQPPLIPFEVLAFLLQANNILSLGMQPLLKVATLAVCWWCCAFFMVGSAMSVVGIASTLNVHIFFPPRPKGQ